MKIINSELKPTSPVTFTVCLLVHTESCISSSFTRKSHAVNPNGRIVLTYSRFPFTLVVAASVFALHVGHCVFASVHVFIEKLFDAAGGKIFHHTCHSSAGCRSVVEGSCHILF